MYKRLEVIKQVIKEIKGGIKLPRALGNTEVKSLSTWYNWETQDKRVEKLRKAAESLSDDKRNGMVEDAYFQKLVKGLGSAADYIFYLVNRVPNRWKNDYKVEHSGEIKGSGPIVIGIPVERLADYDSRVNKEQAKAGFYS